MRLARTGMLAASVLLCACDIVQGFQHAGDALFPPVKTYLDVPGYRVAAGGYRRMNVIYGAEIYLLARPSDRGDRSLYAMRYAAPEPCKVANVARYWAHGHPRLSAPPIAYFEEEVARGTLRFSDTDCRALELTVPDAHLPLAIASDDSLLVMSGDDLVAAEPWRGTVRTVVTGVERVLDAGRSGTLAVIAEGRLDILVTHEEPVRVEPFGAGVVHAVETAGAIYYEDAEGIHRVEAGRTGPIPRFTKTKTFPGACRLAELVAPDLEAWLPGRWLAFSSDCSPSSWVVHDTVEQRAVPLPNATERSLDPARIKLVPAPDPASRAMPDLDAPLWRFELDEVDADSGTGRLSFFTPDGETHVIGERAGLDFAVVASVTMDGGRGYDHGYAVVDIDGETGRAVRFHRDGRLEDIAERAYRYRPETPFVALLSDFDGATGTLSQLTRQGLHELARGVPHADSFAESRLAAFPMRVLWHDVENQRGTLSRLLTSSDPNALAHDDFGVQLAVPQPLSRRVHLSRSPFLDELPGFVYLADYDAARGTGRLEYQNFELGFTSTIADGVADLLQPGNGVLYSVPAGPSPGIWLSRAK